MCTVSLSAENCIGLLIVNHRFLCGSTAASSCSNSQYCLIVCGLALQATLVVCVLHAVVGCGLALQATIVVCVLHAVVGGGLALQATIIIIYFNLNTYDQNVNQTISRFLLSFPTHWLLVLVLRFGPALSGLVTSVTAIVALDPISRSSQHTCEYVERLLSPCQKALM